MLDMVLTLHIDILLHVLMLLVLIPKLSTPDAPPVRGSGTVATEQTSSFHHVSAVADPYLSAA